ncbi:beta-1,4-N-acetylgalactosaminyltransferase bre-4-like [Centruroides vittatus]|uniref:beta-1,4-N-acetylgalactosaminyltransferase bre-4-like n=1 Tax=Centruroides vittatus TaxID=120091 RepID=UPI00351030E5
MMWFQIKIRLFLRRFHQKFLSDIKDKPIAIFLIVFIIICILLPLRSPAGTGYNYLTFPEIRNDLIKCVNFSSTSTYLQCPSIPDNLGSFTKVQKVVNETLLKNLAKRLEIRPGGLWHPQHCQPLYKVAIIVPYRNREHHLKLFLQHMHLFLQAQLLDYGIFIVEQSEKHDFNRGKLFNIGFIEALKLYDYCCFVFHDVDILPENPQHIYSCSKQPRHMSSALDTFRYVLPYKDIFGGVVAFSKEQFIKINGYSNNFFGWGGEDDDLADRLKSKELEITRWEPKISQFTMIFHNKAVPNPERFNLLKYGKERFENDGLNSLHYKVLKLELKNLYTRIVVDVKP